MSQQAHGWLPRLRPGERTVLLVLWDYSDPRGEREVWPSQETIAAATGQSLGGVKKALRELRQVGAIVPVDLGRRSQAYRLTPRPVCEKSGSTQGPLNKTEGSTQGPPRVHPGTPKGPPRDPQGSTQGPQTTKNNQEQPEEQQSAFALVAPTVADVERQEPDRRLWERQEELRAEVAAALGIKIRALRPTGSRLRRVRGRLADSSESDCAAVLEVYAREALASGSLQWLNGDTNWRPANFDRALAKVGDAGPRHVPDVSSSWTADLSPAATDDNQESLWEPQI